MNGKHKVLVAAGDDDLKRILERLSADLSDFEFDHTPVQSPSLLNGKAVSTAAIVIEIDASQPSEVDDLAAFTRASPDRRVIAATPSTGPEEVRRLFRAGAADVVTAPFTAEALRTALLDLVSGGRPSAGGAIITTLKAGGGAGATTVTLNLARCLSHGFGKGPARVRSTAVLDLDLQFGDAGACLNVEPRSTLLDVLRGGDRFDARFLQSVLSEGAGLKLLAAPPTLVPMEAMSGELALDIVQQSAQLHDLTLVDMPDSWSDWTPPVLQRSHLIALVANPTVSSVLRARRILDALVEAKVTTPVFLVLNRLNGVFEASDKPPRVERSLNHKVEARLTQDAMAVRAADRGQLVVEAFPSARISRDLRSAAAALDRELSQARRATLTVAGDVA